jgi:hypothetical protein
MGHVGCFSCFFRRPKKNNSPTEGKTSTQNVILEMKNEHPDPIELPVQPQNSKSVELELGCLEEADGWIHPTKSAPS